MEESERQKYEAQAQDLRVALKQFESDWAHKNNGTKPPREAIKGNPIIGTKMTPSLRFQNIRKLKQLTLCAAQKYKQYNKVRDILDGKTAPPKKENRQRKRQPDVEPSQTPSKRSRPATTPSKPKQQVDLFDGFETPSIRRLFSPAVPTSIGPTPQRDGRVLGLFDLMSEKDENTPSRSQNGDVTQPDFQVQATPSKRTRAEMEADHEIQLGRTPQSTSKRNMLDSFMTPLKDRNGNVQGSKTPSSVSKLQFATPSFLRRAPLPPPVDENGTYKSPQRIRLPRKPLVRGLSSVVASLRKMEEEKLDDDLDALREMEDMENDTGMNPPARPLKATEKPRREILEPDSQGHQLLGGFDNEDELDSEPEVQLGRDGQPLRVYKKKGQKRTTRKVNMRPTRARRPQESLESAVSEDEGADGEVVPETQFYGTKPMDGEDSLDLGSDSDFGGSDGEDERPKKKAKTLKKREPKKKEPAKKATGEEKEHPIKKAAKKVNAMAHANFKRLKLRNNGAKGGPGFGSKFRRRR